MTQWWLNKHMLSEFSRASGALNSNLYCTHTMPLSNANSSLSTPVFSLKILVGTPESWWRLCSMQLVVKEEGKYLVSDRLAISSREPYKYVFPFVHTLHGVHLFSFVNKIVLTETQEGVLDSKENSLIALVTAIFVRDTNNSHKYTIRLLYNFTVIYNGIQLPKIWVIFEHAQTVDARLSFPPAHPKKKREPGDEAITYLCLLE